MKKRLSPKEYINMVNKAVREGRHNRPIKVVFTKNKPTTEGKQGIATHINLKRYDRIAIWKGLARNKKEQASRSKMLSKKLGRPINVITQEDALRHELWHVHRPYASEKVVRGTLEKQNLPNKLPTRRRYE